MPRETPSIFYFLVLLSLAFLASQLLMSLLLYTDDILQKINIFESLAPISQREHTPSGTCETESCDKTSKTVQPREQHDEADGNCGKGFFHLKPDSVCHPLLTCEDFGDVIVTKRIGGGAVKRVYLAEWKGHTVVFSNLTHPDLLEDFVHGADMLHSFQPSDLVVQLVGFCKTIPALLTEYHSLGSMENINSILLQKDVDNLVTRFSLCLNYVRIIDYLHTSPVGIRVMCDSNDLPKTLSQFLVTSDLQIVINDLDALPLVDSTKGLLTTCGHRQIVGDFVAFEQLWPYPEKEYTEDLMPGYDEKTDIWKIPTVVDYLLGNNGDVVRFSLYKVHSICKSIDPRERLTAAQVLEEYLEIKHTLQL